MYYVLFLFLFMWSWAFAHQTSITSGGNSLFWPNSNIPIYINANTSDLPASTATNIILNSMNEWNLTGAVNVYSAPASNNQISFTTDFSIYGSAVIGVTEISYNPAGAISKAVILLNNDNYNFTSTQSSLGTGSIFLGDVVTHELGHLFGLSHSEVLNASMFYTSFPGQSTISADDRSGLIQKYGGSLGSISGKVQGGDHIGILGVHVQAISKSTAQSVGVITDEEGNFQIEGLDLGDTYYIYTAPLKNIQSLPGYFANVQTEFCPGTYVGSFYSQCGKEYEGFPQPLTLTPGAGDLDVGVVTINCGLKANEDYSYQKLQSTFAPVTIWNSSEGAIRDKSFVGYFTQQSTSTTSWTAWETLKVDMSGVPSASGRYMKANFLAHPFGNLLEYEMRLLQNGVIVSLGAISTLSVGTYNTDMSAAAAINSSPASNIFEIQVRAKKLTNSKIPLTFPSSTLFTSDSHLPYLLVISVWDSFTPLFNTSSYLSDNENCLEAPFTYKVNKAKAQSENAISGQGDAASAAASSCGTIEPPKGGGPGSSLPLLVLGFSLTLLAGYLGKKSKNFLS
ncbi:MAG TPA: matrixin family metalloprotease [Bacteriovoracaceae bacterium]|nr:matrixin family metalloprotease [Bacteriovoracaceae bacterium]